MEYNGFTVSQIHQYAAKSTRCNQCDKWFFKNVSNIPCNIDHGGMCCHLHDLHDPVPRVESESESESELVYKFNEDELLEEFRAHIDTTYRSYYGETKLQANDMIFDAGHGIGFCVGNIMKYVTRYGRKEGYNRQDIMKVLHYSLLLLHLHDQEHSE